MRRPPVRRRHDLLYVLTALAVQEQATGPALSRAPSGSSPNSRARSSPTTRSSASSSVPRQAQSWPHRLGGLPDPAPAVSPEPLRRQLTRPVCRGRDRKRPARRRPGASSRPLRPRSPPPTPVAPSSCWAGRARRPATARALWMPICSRGRAGTGAAGLSKDALVQQARILLEEKRWNEARGVLEPLLKSPEAVAPSLKPRKASARAYQGEGNYLAAAEYFMTAAYVAPESPAGRRACWARRQLRRAQAERLGGGRLPQADRADGCAHGPARRRPHRV